MVTAPRLTWQEVDGPQQGGGVLLQDQPHVGQQRVRADTSGIDHIAVEHKK